MPDRGYGSMINMVLVGAFAFTSAFLRAQATGQVRIVGVPDQGMRYILDGKYRMSDRQITLSEGDHRFVFWAPEHAMLDTSVFVMGNWTTLLKIQLRRTPEYLVHREAVERYERRARIGRTVPLVLAGAFGAWAAVSTIRYAGAHSDLKDMKVRYTTLSDPTAIQLLKQEEIPEAQDRFRSARTQTFISSGGFVLSLAAAAYIRHQLARSSPPAYDDRERIRFEGLVWTPDASGSGFWTAGLTIPLR